MAQITPARKLFDLLVSRDFDPEMLDSAGKAAPDPTSAEIFSFDFRAESGKDYGTVVIMLGDDNSLDVFCADNVGKTMEGSDKNDWFAFLEQLKHFAVKNFMSFSTKNLNRLRYSMQGQAAIKEGLFESWSGKKDVSWNAGANESRLMIKHKRALGEGEARFRCVESLFIETAEGERYKLPFRNLTAGKAMLEHVRTGGRPYDLRGQHIAEMVNELTVLSRFKRANAGKLLEGDTATLVEQATTYFENLRHNLKSLATRTGYTKYFESWSPMELTQEEVVIEGLKHLFVTQSIDQRIEEALPLIARIQQQENAMKEAAIFESWADQLMEGTWQTPDTPEKQAELIKLLSTDLPVGADATNATEQLYDLLGDDELFDQLQELAQRDANADARQVIINRMQELDQDPDVMKVITSLNIDATAEMNPPEQTPADLDDNPAAAAKSGWTPERMAAAQQKGSYKGMDETVKDPADQTEDPEGTAQPDYPEYAEDLSSILKHAGVPAQERPAPDYEPELKEEQSEASFAMRNAAKDFAKKWSDRYPGNPSETAAENEGDYERFADAFVKNILQQHGEELTPKSLQKGRSDFDYYVNQEFEMDEMSNPGVTPADIDGVPAEELDEASRCNMTEAGASCPVHGLKECGMYEASALQGQYGHSGKMKPVAQDTTFLDRLKELSGMIRN
jgi:hypothetical protein